MVLEFKVHEQTIEAIASNVIPRRKSREYLSLKFYFAEDWGGYLKTVYFQYEEDSEPIVLDDTSEVIVPNYFAQHDHFLVMLIGIDGDVSCPTNVLCITLDESGTVWTQVPPDTDMPAYQQLVMLAQAAAHAADHASEDAARAMEAAQAVEEIAEDKQDKLIAGDGITIGQDGKTISSTGGSGGTSDHRQLSHRNDPNQHPISAITGLQEELDEKLNEYDIADWAKAPEKPEYDAEEINYDGEIDGYAVKNVKSALDVVSEAIDDLGVFTGEINAKIPQQASASNQLADKDFVNSSIENVAAYYITKDAAGNPFATKAELNAATVFYSGGQVRVPTRNDYTVVLADESKIDAGVIPTTRYLYYNGWNYQYIVNNTALTADQWKAVNSGISAEILDGLASKAYAEQAADQALADAKIYTDNIVGNIESAINIIRGVTA